MQLKYFEFAGAPSSPNSDEENIESEDDDVEHENCSPKPNKLIKVCEDS